MRAEKLNQQKTKNKQNLKSNEKNKIKKVKSNYVLKKDLN
jgi:hypothetical protein